MAAVVLIAGGSGSGKSTLARAVASRYRAALLTVDRYYRGFEDIPLERRRLLNFDAPEAIEHELLAFHLAELAIGKPIQIPCYDFAGFARLPDTERIEPSDVIVIEGLFALYWDELRRMANLGVYMGTGGQICLERRMRRDLVEFGRTAEDAMLRYTTYVKPNYERYVRPTSQFAHLHLDGTLPVADLVDEVRRRLDVLTMLTPA